MTIYTMTQKEIVGLIISIVGLLIIAVGFTLMLYFFNKSDKKNIIDGERDIELIDQDLYLTKPSVKRRSKILAIIGNVFFYLMLAILVPLIIVSIISRANGNYFMIGGKGIISVASDSMAYKNIGNKYVTNNDLNNQVHRDDLLVISKVSEEDLNIFDVIIFKADTGEIKIHRIVEIKDSAEGKLYVTQGDSNDTPDSDKTYYSDIIARYDNKRVGGIGVLALFLNSYIGMFTLMTLIYCMCALGFFRSKNKKVREERLKKISIIFNPEKHNTVLAGALYYGGYKYNYADNKFTGKEAVESGSMRKLSEKKIIKEENGSLSEIEVEYFDPKYQGVEEHNALDSMIEELEKKKMEGNKND